MPELDFHENLHREEEAVGSSDRGFGLLIGAVVLLIGAVKWWNGSASAWWWLAASGVVTGVAMLQPRLLAPLNRLWLQLGLLLYQVVNPIVMALIFYGAVLPTALALRLTRKDLLRLKRDPAAASYWIARQPSGTPAETMKHQF